MGIAAASGGRCVCHEQHAVLVKCQLGPDVAVGQPQVASGFTNLSIHVRQKGGLPALRAVSSPRRRRLLRLTPTFRR